MPYLFLGEDLVTLLGPGPPISPQHLTDNLQEFFENYQNSETEVAGMSGTTAATVASPDQLGWAEANPAAQPSCSQANPATQPSWSEANQAAQPSWSEANPASRYTTNR